MSAHVLDAGAIAGAPGDDRPTLQSRDAAIPLMDLRKVCRTFVTDGGVEVQALLDVDLKI